MEMNIYSGSANGLGYNIFTNGVNGVNLAPGSVSFASGHQSTSSCLPEQPHFVDLHRHGQRRHLRFPFRGQHPGSGESIGLCRFPAADGGTASTRIITNFTFISLASPAAVAVSAGASVVVSWNGLINGYILQQNSNLSTTNWVDVPLLDVVTNGLHQITIPASSTNVFYRLSSSN